MKTFQVTLSLSFTRHYLEEDDDSQRVDAFHRTDTYYEEHDIKEYIKTYDALGLVEYLYSEGEVLSAEWDRERFAIHILVETDETKEEVCDSFQHQSLEDGEYEACCENGWLIFTRGPHGEVYDGLGSDAWEYGLLDYRDTPVHVVEV